MEETNGNKTNVPMHEAEEKKNPAFHLFLYLVSFFSLGFVVQGIISIYFQIINKLVKDPLDVTGYYSGQLDSGALKMGISSLIVSFPIYYLLVYFINKKLEKGEIDPFSKIRKFITYFAMFVFSAMSIGSLIVLLYNYLDGEFTAKFFLKSLVFFVVSIFFFVFYLKEIRRKEFPGKFWKPLFVLSMMITLSALAGGLLVVDSPTVAREKKLDKEVVEEMNTVMYDIKSFYTANNRLPKVEENEIKPGKAVEYSRTGEAAYELCATFKQPAEKAEVMYGREDWSHPAGRYCFKFNALSGGEEVPAKPINQ